MKNSLGRERALGVVFMHIPRRGSSITPGVLFFYIDVYCARRLKLCIGQKSGHWINKFLPKCFRRTLSIPFKSQWNLTDKNETGGSAEVFHCCGKAMKICQ